MGRNTGKNDAPLATINGAVKIELAFGEMRGIMNHCNILKDFLHTPLPNGRALHKNSKILSEKVEELNDEGLMIDERKNKIYAMFNDPKSTPEQKEEVQALLSDLTKETVAFNKRKYDMHLHTVSVKDYPEDPEKFGKKSIPQQDGSKVEIDYYSSFLELSDVIIVD